MESSHFNRLPRELRDIIWRLALQREECIYIFDDNGEARIDADTAKQHPLALTATCNQIRDECDAMFFEANCFSIASSTLEQTYKPNMHKQTAGAGMQAFREWLQTLSNRASSALKHINISLGELYHLYIADNDVRYHTGPIKELADFMSLAALANVSWTLSFVAYDSPTEALPPVKIDFENVEVAAPSTQINKAVSEKRAEYDRALKDGKLDVEAHRAYDQSIMLCGAKAKRLLMLLRKRKIEREKIDEIKSADRAKYIL